MPVPRIQFESHSKQLHRNVYVLFCCITTLHWLYSVAPSFPVEWQHMCRRLNEFNFVVKLTCVQRTGFNLGFFLSRSATSWYAMSPPSNFTDATGNAARRPFTPAVPLFWSSVFSFARKSRVGMHNYDLCCRTFVLDDATVFTFLSMTQGKQ